MSAHGARIICCLVAVVVAAVVNAGAVDIPRTINYQGLLTDKETGEPLSGTYSLTFSLYAQASGGAPLWSETKDVTTDESGIFATLLGSANPINLTFDTPCWLEIAVGGETLAPRRGLASVPYTFQALNALNADSLGGLTSASYALVGHLHDDTYVNEGQAGSVTAGMIAGGAGSGLDADLLDGQHGAAFAGAAHQHDDRYYTESELNTGDGAVNQAGDPLDWTKLKGMPEGFADGTDNAGSGDGHSLDAADGDPTDALWVDDEGKVLINVSSFSGARLQVYNATDTAIWGQTDNATGVMGISVEGIGISGTSEKGPGVGGFSTDGMGISGTSVNNYGVIGYGTNAHGVYGTSNEGCGVVGYSDYNYGVSGYSADSSGIFGRSDNDPGVVGYSIHAYGIAGYSTDSCGVFGQSDNAPGVVGYSTNGKAGDFWGEVHASGRVDSDSGFSIDGQTLLAAPGENNLFVGRAARLYFEVPQGSTCIGDSTGSSYLGSDNTFLGYRAGNGSSAGFGDAPAAAAVTGDRNVFVGARSGAKNYEDENVFLGYAAGQDNTGGFRNTFVGAAAGHETESGPNNVFLGASAGWMNSTGAANVCCGAYAGQYRSTGGGNTYVGYEAGGSSSGQIGTTGDSNVGVGLRAGYEADGSRNVFLGFEAGYGFSGSDRLFVANGRNLDDVLIYGNFATGNIGLGTTAPERRLHILGDGPRVLVEAMTGNPEVNLKVTGDSWGDIWAMYKHVEDGDLHFFQGGDRVTFEGGTGNVAIGTTDPAGYRLYVNGTAYATGGWTPSDLRLKADLAGIGDALGKIMRLNGMSFRWRTEDYPDRGFPEGRHYGLVAQEVEEVLPEVVGSGPDGEKALAYSELIPVLVESVKQLKAENDALRARIEALEGREN